MKLIIIRHGDPDYSIDSLTERGWKEAELLSERISKLDVKAFYCSPLGRAKDTAKATLAKMKRDAEILPWLEEFPARATHIGNDKPSCAWDWLPGVWTKVPEFYDKDEWMNVSVFKEGNVGEIYGEIISGFDALLEKHGYKREGGYYRAVAPNRDTIVLFCHFALECVLLSHLLGVSPMTLWHGTCAAPTSVTTLNTEERREGIAYFRMSAFGDISHLYVKDVEPAFAARFCETYTNFDERHD